MVTNKDKVILLPKEFQNKGDLFVCPCPVCVEKFYTQIDEKTQIDQAKNIIEEIFENSSLNSSDFKINIDYARATAIPLKQKVYPEVRASQAGVKAVLSFTAQFNKKYRHTLICKLDNLAQLSQLDLDSYSAMVQYGDLLESRLWKMESIAKKIDQIGAVLSLIESEDFIEKEKITQLKDKISYATRENKAQLKKLFISALKIPEFEPHCSYEDFHLPYY